MYVDAHCHIDHYSDPVAALTRAEAADVETFAVTESPARFRTLQLFLGQRKGVRVALGFHPLHVQLMRAHDYSLFSELLDRAELVGEIGLDGSPQGRSSLDLQIHAFEWILQEPTMDSKLLSIHSRGAELETVKRLEQSNVRSVLHWYSGPMGVLDRALDLGCYFSVNSAMFRSKSGQRVLKRLPRDRVLTETDGPYISQSGRDICPSDIPLLVGELAELWGVAESEARASVQRNLSAALALDRSERRSQANVWRLDV